MFLYKNHLWLLVLITNLISFVLSTISYYIAMIDYDLLLKWVGAIGPILVSLSVVFLTWRLNEQSKRSTEERDNSKKINKVLFYLLSIRYELLQKKSQSFNRFREEGIALYFQKIEEKTGKKIPLEEQSEAKLMILNYLSKLENKLENEESKSEFMQGNINKIISEISAVFPLIAYDLEFRYIGRDRLEKMNAYKEHAMENVPTDFKYLLDDINQFSKSVITQTEIEELEMHIKNVASLLGRKKYKMIKEELKREISMEIPKESMEAIINVMIEKVAPSIR